MGWELSACRNLAELANRTDSLEKSSVIHFSFSFTIILTLIFMLIYRQMSPNKSVVQLLLVSSFFFYVINVIRLAFFPLPINETYIELLKKEVDCGIIIERRHNLQLFDFMKWGNLFHITTVGNLLMLMPLSFYCPLIFKRKKWSLYRMIFIGFFISLTIETIQLSYDLITGYAYRGFNVDDLMMNTVGVFIGYLIYVIIKCFIWIIMKFLHLIYQNAR